MAKKKGTKSKKAKPAGSAKAPHRTAAAPEASERERDPRLPPPGTVIQRRDRAGAVRCECTIDKAGVRYEGKLYRSLSAAALAAAGDLGTPLRAVNGFTWWGLSKPARRDADPLAALGRAWDRYLDRATSVVAAVADKDPDHVRDTIEKHADAIAHLRKRVA